MTMREYLQFRWAETLICFCIAIAIIIVIIIIRLLLTLIELATKAYKERKAGKASKKNEGG